MWPIFFYPEEMHSNIGNRKIKMAEEFRKVPRAPQLPPTTPGSWWSNRSFGGFRWSTWGTGWCYRQGSWTRHGAGWKLGNGHQLWIAMLKPRYLPTPKICQHTLFLRSTGNWGKTFFWNTTSCHPLNHDRTGYVNAALFFPSVSWNFQTAHWDGKNNGMFTPGYKVPGRL